MRTKQLSSAQTKDRRDQRCDHLCGSTKRPLSDGGERDQLIRSNSYNADPEDLRELAVSSSANVRKNVASNRHTPVDVAIVLSNDESANVRAAIVFWCSKIPASDVSRLARDEVVHVRRNAAFHPALPELEQEALIGDDDETLRMNLLENRRLSWSAMRAMLLCDPEHRIQAAAESAVKMRYFPDEIAGGQR